MLESSHLSVLSLTKTHTRHTNAGHLDVTFFAGTSDQSSSSAPFVWVSEMVGRAQTIRKL